MITPLYFIKYFKEEAHADQFQNGTLYMNRLSYFRNLEETLENVRADTYEGAAKIWQPKSFSLEFKSPGMKRLNIYPRNLSGPVAMTHAISDYWHIFSMYALSVDLPCDRGLYNNFSNQEKRCIKSNLHVDERCLNFGPFAVIVKIREFLDQVLEAMRKQNMTFRARMVDYYDPAQFHGAFADDEIMFNKSMYYSYQNEYRICASPLSVGRDPIRICIDSIAAISQKLPSRDINRRLMEETTLTVT